METPVIIRNHTIRLKAMLSAGSSDCAVVSTHPNPLYGGNMDNPMIIQIADSFDQQGFATLRFDFRGTGDSQYRHV